MSIQGQEDVRLTLVKARECHEHTPGGTSTFIATDALAARQALLPVLPNAFGTDVKPM